MWSSLKQVFQKRPLLMSVTTLGALYTGAEYSQQLVLLRVDPNKKSVDWNTVKNFAIFGTFILGPSLFYWFRFLDARFPGVGIKAMKKIVIDQTMGAPAFHTSFFVSMSLLEGKEDIFAELKAKFLQTYAMSCCFWLPAQAINFCFLPPYTRVAFVGCASFVWVNVLCLIKRREVPGVPKSVEITAVANES